MKLTIAIFIASLLTTSSAFAQSSSAGIPTGAGPGAVPFGSGTQRGLQQLNNSGINGFVTIFDRGAKTAIVVAIDGSNRRAKRAAIVRGHSCDAIGDVAAGLHDVQNGVSRGYVPLAKNRLTSGNYLAVVYSNTTPKAHPIACGELYN